jgi:hypothetical protein
MSDGSGASISSANRGRPSARIEPAGNAAPAGNYENRCRCTLSTRPIDAKLVITLEPP